MSYFLLLFLTFVLKVGQKAWLTNQEMKRQYYFMKLAFRASELLSDFGDITVVKTRNSRCKLKPACPFDVFL